MVKKRLRGVEESSEDLSWTTLLREILRKARGKAMTKREREKQERQRCVQIKDRGIDRGDKWAGRQGHRDGGSCGGV